MDYSLKKRKAYIEDDIEFLEKKIKYTENENEILFYRNYRVFSLNHEEISDLNIYDKNIVSIICSPAEDRLSALNANINDWVTRGFKCLLFFSESENNIDFINKIKNNKKTTGYHHLIKYVVYSLTDLVDIQKSAGIARVSALLFLDSFLLNRNANIVISDDRRKIATLATSNIAEVFAELLKNNDDILFPCSSRSWSQKEAKNRNPERDKNETLYNIDKLGQVYIMTYSTVKKICTNKEILKYMSAPIFEDYVLKHLPIKMSISKNCGRVNHVNPKKKKIKTIARKNMSYKDIKLLLSNPTSTGYLLKLVLSKITKYPIELYDGQGYELHRKILATYMNNFA